MWRHLFLTLPIAVLIVAFFQTSALRSLRDSLPIFLKRHLTTTAQTNSSTIMANTPVYFFSHGGPDVQYRTEHPVYPILQSIGREITQKVRPKAVVVFSAHWQSTASEIHLNNAVSNPLIYDFYGFPPEFYKATFPSTGSPEIASQIIDLLTKAGIPAKGLARGLDHGVFSGFNVAFDQETNPLTVPLIQVSLYDSENPTAHYDLGRAVSSLRSDNVVIICTGMSVHNLRDMRRAWGSPTPLPYAVSFDNALKEAVEADPKEREEKMKRVCERPDAREAHPWMDHLMPLYIAAGAAGDDVGKQTWTMQEGSFAWAQYRFGDVPE